MQLPWPFYGPYQENLVWDVVFPAPLWLISQLFSSVRIFLSCSLADEFLAAGGEAVDSLPQDNGVFEIIGVHFQCFVVFADQDCGAVGPEGTGKNGQMAEFLTVIVAGG